MYNFNFLLSFLSYVSDLISVLKTGTVTQAKGSAYIEQGQTKAICAVYGPREIPRRSDFSMKGILNCVVDHTAFAQKRRKPPGSQDSSEEDMSISLAQALEATVCMVSPNSFCQSQLVSEFSYFTLSKRHRQWSIGSSFILCNYI